MKKPAPRKIAQTAPMPKPEASAPKPNKPTWECKVDTAPADGKGYTVGEKFEIECNGASLILQEPLQLKVPEKAEYGLVLLKTVSVAPNQVRLEATTYRPGEWQFDYVDVVDANGQGFLTSRLAFKTQSVINPQKPPESIYFSVVALKMPVPPWVFVAPVAVFCVLIGWFLIFLRRNLQRQILEKNIKKFQSPLGSYHQFSKDLRALKRANVFSEHQEWAPGQVSEYLKNLNENFRLFLLREFIVPATTWTSRNTVRHIKRKDKRGYEKYRLVLLKALKELDRAILKPEGFKSKDCEQLTQICWQAVDLIWKTKREKGGKS